MHNYTIDDFLMKQRWKKNEIAAYVGTLKSETSIMKFFWMLLAQLLFPCCFAKSVAGNYVRQCKSPGELPAPHFVMNGTPVQEGEWVLLQCLLSNEFEVKNFYFCKDGHPLSTPTAFLYNGIYKVSLQISQQSAGQYSCGYQRMDRESQMKKFAHSTVKNLIVLSETKRPVLARITAFVIILFLGFLLCFLLKKYAWPKRCSWEEAPIKMKHTEASEEQIYYAEIVKFSKALEPASQNLEDIYMPMAGGISLPMAEDIYLPMAPLRKHLNFDDTVALETLVTVQEDSSA
ncbi:uncharacterized protein LOC134495517 [Candoia aspera]|uniref:uncharacterized protein LOC134495517 n=1 Tax=Candoia aspera TaxID=51853 RepID=UPI002FD87987